MQTREQTPLRGVYGLEKGDREEVRPMTLAATVSLLVRCAPYVNQDPLRMPLLLDRAAAIAAGTARGNKAASKRASASSRDRIVRNWSCSLVSRSFGEGVLVIPELISIPQHIGINRAACRKAFRAA